MTRLAVWLLAALLLASGCLASEDYFYDEEAAAEEETVSKHVPTFSSRSERFDRMKGEEVTLPCLVDKTVGTVVWKHVSGNQENTLFMDTIALVQGEDGQRFKLDPMGSKGNSLIISDLKATDSGTYVCELGDSVSLEHTVNVKYAPIVTMEPESGVRVIPEKSPTTMACTATGNPTPTITWTREDGGLLPGGKQKMEGSQLAIAAVDRAHMGKYACTVDNGVGDAVVKRFQLEVTFPPAIEVAAETVHSGPGYEAQLTCTVHGQPMPEVTWGRSGGASLDPARHLQTQDGARYSLSIDEVHESDLGQYTCRARSDLGTAVGPIVLTGAPKRALITSPSQGQQKDTYTLRWNVESYAPVTEYNITYKMAEKSKSSPQQKWEVISLEAPPKDGSTVMYSHEYVLSDLAPATPYEAVVVAKNKYGWSQEPEAPFKLFTLGQPLGSTGRGAGGSVRSGALAVAAAICALIAAL